MLKPILSVILRIVTFSIFFYFKPKFTNVRLPSYNNHLVMRTVKRPFRKRVDKVNVDVLVNLRHFVEVSKCNKNIISN